MGPRKRNPIIPYVGQLVHHQVTFKSLEFYAKVKLRWYNTEHHMNKTLIRQFHYILTSS